MIKNMDIVDAQKYISKNDSKTILVYLLDKKYPCKLFGNHIDTLSKKYTNIKFIKIIVEDGKTFSKKNNIDNYPTLIIYKYGIYQKKYEGYKSLEEIEKLL